MMKKVLAIILFAAFVITGCSDSTDPVGTPPPLLVKAFFGEAYANNELVSGATVTITCSICQEADKKYEWVAETDETGRWLAKDRPPIDHTEHILDCLAEKDGYKPHDFRYRVLEEGPIEVPAFRLKPE